MFFAATLAAITLATGSLANIDTVYSFKAVNAGSCSAGSLYGAKVIAAGGSLYLNYPNNATCDQPLDRAEFYFLGDTLNLYERTTDYSQVWVDRSGMGQGVTGYTFLSEKQHLSRNAERNGWEIVDGALKFKGQDFYACSSYVGSHVLWVDVGDSTPGNQDGCVKVALHAIREKSPVVCAYTTRDD